MLIKNSIKSDDINRRRENYLEATQFLDANCLGEGKRTFFLINFD